MGIVRSMVALLIEESFREPFAGSIATLGNQDVLLTSDEMEKVASRYGVALPEATKFMDGTVQVRDLFESLGFTNVTSIDNSDYENADVLMDLNVAGVPQEHRQKYDVVLDGGTLEHIFHVPNVFSNIFELLKPGGRVVHFSPSSNNIDHGFYMFSPTLFHDYYRANHFELNSLYVYRYKGNRPDKYWDIFESAPGSWEDVSTGGLDDYAYGVFVVATKTNESSGDVIPQQNRYALAWESNGGTAMPTQSLYRKVLKSIPLVRLSFQNARKMVWKLQGKGPTGRSVSKKV
jgi:hypothetical protein